MTTAVEEQAQNAEIEETLINELELMFTRERLEKNNYFIYRMSMNLEIPLQAVYDERSIKSITQDPELVLRALKKTKNVTVNEAKEHFIPSIKALTNKIIINVEAKEEPDFRKFLQAENWTNNNFELIFDRKNSGRMIFALEADAEDFLEFIKGKKLGEKAIEAYVEPENIFMSFLQNAQESKKAHTAYQEGRFSSRDQGYYYPPNMPQGYPMYPSYPMMGANPYYYPYYPSYGNPYPYYNPYMSSMYIRKAKNEEEGGEDSGEVETYQKQPQYWSPAENSKVQEPESDYKGKYSSYGTRRGRRGGRYSRGGGGGYKRYNESSSSSKGPGGSGNRVRLNSDNFPPLISENDKEKRTLDFYDERETREIKIRYKKPDLVKIHQELSAKGEIKVDPKLARMKVEDIPFLNLHSSSSSRKRSVNN